MEQTTWKTLAIVFMALFVLETIVMVWAFNAGTEMMDQEYECAINICGDEHDAFFYDEYAEVCYCYSGSEIVYEEFIG